MTADEMREIQRKARQYITERELDSLLKRARAGDTKALEILIDMVIPVARRR